MKIKQQLNVNKLWQSSALTLAIATLSPVVVRQFPETKTDPVKPNAVISVDNTSGQAPLKVQLSAATA